MYSSEGMMEHPQRPPVNLETKNPFALINFHAFGGDDDDGVTPSWPRVT